jgi:hypothetical protein
MGVNKYFLIAVIAILLAAPAHSLVQPLANLREKVAEKAADNSEFKILVDGNDFEAGGTLTAGSTMNVRFVIPNGARITRVVVHASNPSYEALLQDMLEKAKGAEISTEYQISLPKDLPNGESDVSATVVYLDSGMNKQIYQKKTKAKVVGGTSSAGALSALMPDDSKVALINKLVDRKLERINPELDINDLSKKDIEKLKIDVSAFQDARKKQKVGGAVVSGEKALPKIRKLAEKKLQIKYKEAVKAKSDKFKAAAKKLKGKGLDVEVSSQVFEVSTDTDSITKTKFVISVPSNDSTLKKGEVVVEIPKDAAQNLDDINFITEPDEVVDPDPVVKWAFNNVPQGQYVDYSFTVDGDAQNFDVLAASAADSPSFMSRIVNWIVSFFVK